MTNAVDQTTEAKNKPADGCQSNPVPEWLSRPFARLILVGVAYYAAATLGHALSAIEPEGFTTFWPPNGILVACLLLSKRRDWLYVILGAWLANVAFDVSHGRPLWVGCLFGLSNCSEALVGAWLTQRLVDRSGYLSSLRGLVSFMIAAPILGAAVGATIGSCIVHGAFGAESYWNTWQLWWTGDAVGTLVFAPAILAWLPLARGWRHAPTPRRVAEAMAVYGLLVAVAWAVFTGKPGWPLLQDEYVTLPFMLWIALRFGLRGASAANVTFAVLLVVLQGHATGGGAAIGPYAVLFKITQVQGMLVAFSFVSLLAASIVRQREDALVVMRNSEKALQLRAAFVMNNPAPVLQASLGGEIVMCNPAAEKLFGRSLQGEHVPDVFPDLGLTEASQIRDDLPAYFGAIRSVISVLSAHPFRFNPISDFGHVHVSVSD